MAKVSEQKQLHLLKQIIKYEESADLCVDLTEIEKLIFTELPETLAKNAPANFPELYFDLSRNTSDSKNLFCMKN